MDSKQCRRYELNFTNTEIIQGLKLLFPDDILVQGMPSKPSDLKRFSRAGSLNPDVKIGSIVVHWERETENAAAVSHGRTLVRVAQ